MYLYIFVSFGFNPKYKLRVTIQNYNTQCNVFENWEGWWLILMNRQRRGSIAREEHRLVKKWEVEYISLFNIVNQIICWNNLFIYNIHNINTQHPNDDDILLFAQEVGMDIHADKKYLWLVKSAYRDTLPEGHFAVNDINDKLYYLEIKDDSSIYEFNYENTPHNVSRHHPMVKDVYTKFTSMNKADREKEEAEEREHFKKNNRRKSSIALVAFEAKKKLSKDIQYKILYE